jgi:hypothetical protein
MNILVTLAGWLNPLIYLAGIAAAFRGYARSKKAGYLLLLIFFLLAFGALTVGTRVYGLYQDKTLTSTVQDRINKAYREAVAGSGYVPYADTRTVAIPLANLLLLTGVWLLGGKEK